MDRSPPRPPLASTLLTLAGCALALGAPLARAQSCPPPLPAAEHPDARDAFRRRLSGRYRAASEAANEARRDEAVSRAAAAFFVLIRPIVVSRLTAGVPTFREVRVAFEGGVVEVTTAPVVARSRDDGTPSTTLGFNRALNHLTQRVSGQALLQTTWTDEGSRTTLFTLERDGALTLRVLLRSPQLPVPVSFVGTFVRVRDGATAARAGGLTPRGGGADSKR